LAGRRAVLRESCCKRTEQPRGFVYGIARAQSIDDLRTKLWDFQSQIGRVSQTVTTVSEILAVRKAEAEDKSTIVNTWPLDVVPERVSYLGTGILAAGGISYALSGYPWLTLNILPTLVFWGVGLGLLAYGISRLVRNQREKFDFFRRQFKLEITGEI
jgi:hypothetical protein